MKITRITIAYWIILCVSFAIYQFGFTVTLPFSNESIPFEKLWSTADWESAFKIHLDNDLILIYLTGFFAALALPCLKSDRHRALLLGIVTLIGMAHYDFMMALVMFISPLIVANEFLGNLDGESFSEDIDQAGAAGLLLLYSFFVTLWYCWRLYKNRKPASQEEPRSAH
ncbi:hypothetical protein N9F61_00145 [Akkermansiaceae bacterium]|nr:hypothetical protein [Akkermansiaceae bacterium]MDB4570022.1 hypothetical protein [Akkermansiaceae bacterium]